VEMGQIKKEFMSKMEIDNKYFVLLHQL
jgi:hypothetical protein